MTTLQLFVVSAFSKYIRVQASGVDQKTYSQVGEQQAVRVRVETGHDELSLTSQWDGTRDIRTHFLSHVSGLCISVGEISMRSIDASYAASVLGDLIGSALHISQWKVSNVLQVDNCTSHPKSSI